VYFLFEVGGGEARHRLIQGVWNLGHLALFMLLCIAYLNTDPFNNRSLFFMVSIITIASLILGVTTEAIQLLVKREFSIHDIVNDVLGAYLGLLIHIIRNKTKTPFSRIGAGIIALFFLTIGFRDLGAIVIDEVAIYDDFPVLASFETDAETKRWEFENVFTARNQKFSVSGSYSLKVKYLPGMYSSISLVQMKSDWRDHEQLSLSIFSINQQNLQFEIKVHDKYHTHRQQGYDDRFNKNITLEHGWNFINIPISDIAVSPKGRLMDMSNINKISLFTHKIAQPTILYIDDIRLR
jgi:hypothetical protein